MENSTPIKQGLISQFWIQQCANLRTSTEQQKQTDNQFCVRAKIRLGVGAFAATALLLIAFAWKSKSDRLILRGAVALSGISAAYSLFQWKQIQDKYKTIQRTATLLDGLQCFQEGKWSQAHETMARIGTDPRFNALHGLALLHMAIDKLKTGAEGLPQIQTYAERAKELFPTTPENRSELAQAQRYCNAIVRALTTHNALIAINLVSILDFLRPYEETFGGAPNFKDGIPVINVEDKRILAQDLECYTKYEYISLTLLGIGRLSTQTSVAELNVLRNLLCENNKAIAYIDENQDAMLKTGNKENIIALINKFPSSPKDTCAHRYAPGAVLMAIVTKLAIHPDKDPQSTIESIRHAEEWILDKFAEVLPLGNKKIEDFFHLAFDPTVACFDERLEKIVNYKTKAAPIKLPTWNTNQTPDFNIGQIISAYSTIKVREFALSIDTNVDFASYEWAQKQTSVLQDEKFNKKHMTPMAISQFIHENYKNNISGVDLPAILTLLGYDE